MAHNKFENHSLDKGDRLWWSRGHIWIEDYKRWSFSDIVAVAKDFHSAILINVNSLDPVGLWGVMAEENLFDKEGME